MTIDIALCLLAAAIPLTALVLKFSRSVDPLAFTRLEVEFRLFREEVRKTLKSIEQSLEKRGD